jgi:hypothetical protein
VRRSAKPQSAHFLRPAGPTPGGRAVALQVRPVPTPGRVPAVLSRAGGARLAHSPRDPDRGVLLAQRRRGDSVGTRHPTRRGSGGTQLMAPLTSHLLERCDPFHRVHVNGASSEPSPRAIPAKEPPLMVTPVVGALSGGCHRSGPGIRHRAPERRLHGLHRAHIDHHTAPRVEGKGSERFATSHGDRRPPSEPLRPMTLVGQREFSRPSHSPTLDAFVRRGELGAKSSLHAYPRSARGV